MSMSMPKSDIVSMTRDAWDDHTRYVEALEKEVEALTGLLKRIVDVESGEEEEEYYEPE